MLDNTEFNEVCKLSKIKLDPVEEQEVRNYFDGVSLVLDVLNQVEAEEPDDFSTNSYSVFFDERHIDEDGLTGNAQIYTVPDVLSKGDAHGNN